jgi:hypothetical protein
VVAGFRHLGQPAGDVDRLQLLEALVAEFRHGRRASLQHDVERPVLAVPLQVLPVEIDDDADGVLLVRGVRVAEFR